MREHTRAFLARRTRPELERILDQIGAASAAVKAEIEECRVTRREREAVDRLVAALHISRAALAGRLDRRRRETTIAIIDYALAKAEEGK